MNTAAESRATATGSPATDSGKIRVLVVDERKFRREGTICLLNKEHDIEVVNMRETRGNLALCIEESKPDVLVVLGRCYQAAMDAIKELKSKTRVVVITTPRNVFFSQMLDSGVTGIALETSSKMQLFAAIRSAARNVSYIDPGVEEKDDEWEEAVKLKMLSRRELEIFHRIAQGMENADIGEEMHISERTVKNHVSHILKKLDARNRTQVAVYAWVNGLARIDPEDIYMMLKRQRLSVR